MIRSRLKNRSVKLNKNKEKSEIHGKLIKIITGSSVLGEASLDDEKGFQTKMSNGRFKIRQHRIDRAMTIMQGFQDMRRRGVMLDFFVKVENECFGVHRTILAACSDYFQDVLEKMKDTKEKTFEMRNVDADSVKFCIDFMYSGELNLAMKSLKGVLHAANVMQLKHLIRCCYSYIMVLAKTPENSIEMMQLLQMFPNKNAKEVLRENFTNNFEAIAKTNGFLNLSAECVIDLITNYSKSDTFSLRVVLAWCRHKTKRACFIEELVKVLNFNEFPSDEMLENIRRDSLIVSSETCMQKLVYRIFSDFSKLNLRLNSNNCFTLRKLAGISDDIAIRVDSIFIRFMTEHLDQIFIPLDYLLLSEDDILQLFEGSLDIEYLSSERFKWDAVIKWVTFRSERNKLLPRLLKTIQFNKIPYSNCLMTSPTVRNCAESVKVITNSADSTPDNCIEYVAVLLPNEDLRLFKSLSKTWYSLPEIEDEKILEIFCVNSKLCAITENAIFYLGSGTRWVRRTGIDVCNILEEEIRITASEDYIYFVGTNSLSYYNCLQDKWQCNFVGCGLRNFSVAIVRYYIFAFGIDGAKKYDLCSRTWKDIPPVDGIDCCTSVASMNDMIYVVGLNNHQAMVYRISSGTWSSIRNLPVFDVTQTCAFVSESENLYVLIKMLDGEKLLLYDEVQDQWLIESSIIPKTDKQSDTSSLSGFNYINARGSGSIPSFVPNQKNGKFAVQSNRSSGLFVTPPNMVYESKPSPKHKLITVMSACTFMKKEDLLSLDVVELA